LFREELSIDYFHDLTIGEVLHAINLPEEGLLFNVEYVADSLKNICNI